MRNGTLPLTGGATVGQFVSAWLDGQKESLEPTTWNQYRGHFRNHIEPNIGGVKLTALDAAGVVGFVTRLGKNKTSAAMIRKIVRTLRSALVAAVAADIVPKDPAAKVPLPTHSRPPVRVLSRGDVHALLDAAGGDRLEALIAVAIDSGMRQGELFALTWADFDPNAGTLSVTKSLAELNGKLWVKGVKTEHGRRRVVLSFALDAITGHKARMAAEGRTTGLKGLIFPDTDGGPLRKSNYQRRTFFPLLNKAGVAGLKFHELRHASASLMLLAGVDSKVVSSRLGHGSAGFTANTYQHVIVGMQEKAALALAGVLNGSLQPITPIGCTSAVEGGIAGADWARKNPPKFMP